MPSMECIENLSRRRRQLLETLLQPDQPCSVRPKKTRILDVLLTLIPGTDSKIVLEEANTRQLGFSRDTPYMGRVDLADFLCELRGPWLKHFYVENDWIMFIDLRIPALQLWQPPNACKPSWSIKYRRKRRVSEEIARQALQDAFERLNLAEGQKSAPLTGEERLKIANSDDSILIEEFAPKRAEGAFLDPDGFTDSVMVRFQPKDSDGEKRPLSQTEANEKAVRKLLKDPDFVLKPMREWARLLGCSSGLVAKLPAWKSTKSFRNRSNVQEPISFHLIEPFLGSEDDPLERLIAEQQQDSEADFFDGHSRKNRRRQKRRV